MCTVFRRKMYDAMLAWKKEEKGATALIVRGARRVGKSTLVEDFARTNYKSHMFIDFSNVSPKVNQLFEDLSDLDMFFMQLQVLLHVQLEERQSVIIFDEVQQQPLARQAIKHLVKDRRYDYIETGSLLSIRQNVKDILIPSEETRLDMYPMDFEEFCWAMGDKTTPTLLEQCFTRRTALGEAPHREMMRLFRLYMLVGGMPQAVSEYLNSHNMVRVDQTKRKILDLYDEDFYRIDPTGKTSLLYNAIPSELSRNASRYRVRNVLPTGRNDRLGTMITDLKDSMTVNVAYHANDPNVGFGLSQNIDHFKLYMADTGLFVTQAFRDKRFAENIVYEKLLSDNLSVNLGYIFENVVSQMLIAKGNKLFYYTFPNETQTNSYEVDFLINDGAKVIPLEVKSSGYKTHASLDAFCAKYSSRVSKSYLVYAKTLSKTGATCCIPPYLVPFI